MSARFAALAAFVIVVSASRARADVPSMYGFGSRSTAMGSAVSADVEDFSANYYNPAGIARASALRLDLGYVYASNQLATNGHSNDVDPVHGISGGVVAPGTLFGVRFAFGLAVHLPDDHLSRSRSLPQSEPRWALYDNGVQIVLISANVAIAPFPWLRIGGGLSFVSSTNGTLVVSGQIGYTNPSDTNLGHQVDADLVAVRYPQAGAQVDLLRNLTLALVYRGSYQVNLDIAANIGGNILLGRAGAPGTIAIAGTYVLSSAGVAVFLPQQAVVGLSWRPFPSLTIDADLTWMNWSAYVNPTAQVDVALTLHVPAGVNFATPTLPASTNVLGANFRDTLVPRIGAEWRIGLGPHQFAVRVGYRYDMTPVPDLTGPLNFLDSSRHAIDAGLGILFRGLGPTLPGGISFDVHGEVQLLENRTVLKSDPSDPTGDYVLTGQVWSAGATLGVRF